MLNHTFFFILGFMAAVRPLMELTMLAKMLPVTS